MAEDAWWVQEPPEDDEPDYESIVEARQEEPDEAAIMTAYEGQFTGP